MKFFWYILLPVISTDLVFDGEQAIKLPFLIQHYQEHRQKDPIHFLQFILLHYSQNEHASSSPEHHKLPFKDHQNCTHIHIYFNESVGTHIQTVSYTFQKMFVSDIHLHSTLRFGSVWHPPKYNVLS